MTQGIAEIAGGSEAEIEAERRAFSGVGMPGLGMTEEQDESFEHRSCAKCGKFEVRPRV